MASVPSQQIEPSLSQQLLSDRGSPMGMGIISLILSFFDDLSKLDWACISHVWHNTLLESPDLFCAIGLHSTKRVHADRLVRLSGSRLIRLECGFADDALLTACSHVSPGLRELLVAPSPDLLALPTVWALETLDVRGSLLILPADQIQCTSLRELKLGFWKEDDPDGRSGDLRLWLSKWKRRHSNQARELKAVLARDASHLKVLHMNGLFRSSIEDGLGDPCALANLVQLEALHLRFAVHDARDAARLATLPNLRDLNLRACPVDLPNLLSQNLEELNMSCTRLTPSSLNQLASRCHKLRVLDLCYCDLLDRTALGPLSQHGHHLEMLGLGGFGLVDEDLLLISRTWCGLKNIGIGGAKVTGIGLRALLSLQKLTRLCAHQLDQLEEPVVWELLRQLEAVDLADCQWVDSPSDEVLAAIDSRPYDFDL